MEGGREEEGQVQRGDEESQAWSKRRGGGPCMEGEGRRRTRYGENGEGKGPCMEGGREEAGHVWREKVGGGPGMER